VKVLRVKGEKKELKTRNRDIAKASSADSCQKKQQKEVKKGDEQRGPDELRAIIHVSQTAENCCRMEEASREKRGKP